MVKGNRSPQAGFSLVELLVAVMFIGILMAGMANVFKSSVSTLATSSEGISSARRNRMSIDLLYDDLNTVGLYITDLSSPPLLTSNNPAFYVLPNMPVAGAAADDPQTADQLYFYLDQPLPFEGTLVDTGGGGTNSARSAGQLVMAGAAPVAADNTFTIDCQNASYANMVKVGTAVVIKDSWEILAIQGAPTVAGTTVTFTIGNNPTVAMTGVGPSGAPPKTQHILQSAVLFYQPAQMVRYSVQMKLYDPQKATGVPCLIREQDTYNPGGFDPASPTLVQTVVAENVSGFKAYLSANSGQSWAGLNAAYTGFTNGWSNGIQADLNTQLAASGRPSFTTTAGNPNWIRDIPTLVRLDITTRTATKRAEYSATPLATTAYRDFTQSLVIVPRHSGLTMN
jgi:prepilin-type N-terminal cleavage/methylation domain-containing protein